MSITKTIFIIFLIFSCSVQAEWITELHKSDGSVLVSKSKMKFLTNAEGVRVVVSSTLLEWPETTDPGLLKSTLASTDIKSKNRKYLLKNRSLKEELFGDTQLTVITRNNDENAKQWLLDENCGRNDLILKAKETKVPFFVGISCSVEKVKSTLALSFPEEVSLGRTTIFEIKGKGESWRLFDLGNVAAASGKIAEIELIHNNNPYIFLLVSRKKSGQNQKSTEKKSQIALGIGYETLQLKTNTTTLSDAKPFLSAESVPLIGFLKLEYSAGGQFALSMTSSDKSINFYDFQLRLGSCFKLRSYCISPRAILFSTHFEESSTRGGFSQTIVGGGFAVWKSDTQGFQQLQLSSGQFLSKTIKNQLQLNYIHGFKIGNTIYNLGGQYLSYEYEILGSKRKAEVAAFLIGLSL